MSNVTTLGSIVEAYPDGDAGSGDRHATYEQIKVQLAADLMTITTYSDSIEKWNPLEPSTPSSNFHKQFIQLMNPNSVDVLFLGINPGPHGMGKTGVPFGDPPSVRRFLKIQVPHDRSEVSGRRLWGLMEEICGTGEQFFKHCFLQNLCPVFFTKGKCNKTPFNSDVGPLKTRRKIIEICDNALVDVLELLHPQVIVAIGNEVERRVKKLCSKHRDKEFGRVVKIQHPSRANPRFSKDDDWKKEARNILRRHGIERVMTSQM